MSPAAQKAAQKGGKSRNIDFTAFASPGGGVPADTRVDRVFDEPTPAPWGEFAQQYGAAPPYDTFMVNGTDDRYGMDPWTQPGGTDPWQRGPLNGPQPYVPPPAPAPAVDPWSTFRPGLGYPYPTLDDELSAASPRGTPNPRARGSQEPPSQFPPARHSLAALDANRLSFTQSAVASLTHDYQANPANTPSIRPPRQRER